MTKDELAEWLLLTIHKRAKAQIRYPERNKNTDLTTVANCIYEGLVEDWMYNKNILDACRAMKVSRGSVAAIISDLFDADGKPFPIPKDDSMEAKMSEPSSPAYYASMSTINEEYEEMKKARTRKVPPRGTGHGQLTKQLVGEPKEPGSKTKTKSTRARRGEKLRNN